MHRGTPTLSMDQDTEERDEQHDGLTRRAVLAAAGGAAAVSVSAGTAAAQDGAPTGTASPSGPPDEEGETATATGSPEEDRVLVQLDSGTSILRYQIGDKNEGDNAAHVWVQLESERPRGLVMSDIFGGVAEEGVAKVRQRRLTVESGTQWVKMPATVYDEEYVAVGVATTGGAVTISSGLPDEDEAEVSLPFGVAVGGMTAIAGTGAAAWSKYHDEEDSPSSVFDDDGGLL